MKERQVYKNLAPQEAAKSSGLIWLMISLLLAGTAWQFLTLSPQSLIHRVKSSLDLKGTWEVCLVHAKAWTVPFSLAELEKWPKECRSLEVPKDLPKTLQPATNDILVYRTKFSTPDFCTGAHSQCMLVAGEIGDAAEVMLNGYLVAQHGKLPPEPRYAKNHPLSLSLPERMLEKSGRQNQLSLVVYSLKSVQSGIRKTPIAIVPSDLGHEITRSISFQRVVLPMLMGSGVLLLAIVSLISILVYRVRNRKLWALVAYGIASGSFLISFTEIPREYIPVDLAGCIHYFFRSLMDATLVELVAENFNVWPKLRKLVRPFYAVVLSLFILQFTCSAILGVDHPWRYLVGFDGAFALCHLSAPLVFLPLLYGLISSWKTRRERGFGFVVLFVIAFLIQLNDRLVFLQVIEQVYLLKFLPLPFALTFTIQLWLEHFRDIEKVQRQADLGKIAAQVAHDIRAPLVAARSVIRKLDIDSDKMKLLNTAHSRIENIADELMDVQRSVASTNAPLFSFVSGTIESIISEKVTILETSSNTEIQIDIHRSAQAAVVALSNTDFSRMMSNLLNNSIEAIKTKSHGIVKVSAITIEGNVRISIKDNGIGMTPEVLDQVRTVGGSFGKIGGAGIGLQHAKGLIARANGTISISSVIGQGTTVTLEIPAATTPAWCATSLRFGKHETVVVLDDCQSVHLFWKQKLPNFKLVHLYAPEEFDILLYPQHSCRYIFDYEITGNDTTGLDLIVRHDLGPRAVLATSYFNEPKIQREVQRARSTILPKFMMADVEVTLIKPIERSNDSHDLVLIDDDPLTHAVWRSGAADAGLRLLILDQETDLTQYAVDFETPIYVDKNLMNRVSGVDVARRMYREGYRRVYLATGEELTLTDELAFLSGIQGKDFPDFKSSRKHL